LTGISRSIKANANASNNSVKPLPGRAQGTSTVRTLTSEVVMRNGDNMCAQKSSNVAIVDRRCRVLDKAHLLHRGSVIPMQSQYVGEVRYGVYRP
jgi:hypothetical protein